MTTHLRKLVIAASATALLAGGALPAVASAHASRSHDDVTAHAARKHHHKRHRNRIPQHNGGDQDADNNGGPSDGDGNI